MATHILASWRKVIGWARRSEALNDFVAQGGVAAGSLADLARAAVVISVVFDDEAVSEVALGPSRFIQEMPANAVHVAMETISPAFSRELHDAHAARGQRYLAAPVFGPPEAAAKGELAIMCSGSDTTLCTVEPMLTTAGQPRWIGPEPEQVMLVKLIGDHMILTLSELLGETFAFLSAGGLSGAETKAALLDTLMPRSSLATPGAWWTRRAAEAGLIRHRSPGQCTRARGGAAARRGAAAGRLPGPRGDRADALAPGLIVAPRTSSRGLDQLRGSSPPEPYEKAGADRGGGLTTSAAREQHESNPAHLGPLSLF